MRMRRPRVLAGLLVAAMLTAALTGILSFAWRVAGLPFVPFDTFDWLTRVLPGRLIAFGIGTMVSVIRLLNLGPISSTAKAAEQAMAIAILFIAGVVAGLIVFLILPERGRTHALPEDWHSDSRWACQRCLSACTRARLPASARGRAPPGYSERFLFGAQFSVGQHSG